MQTTGNTEQSPDLDGLYEFFAEVSEDELPVPCCVSRGEILSIQDIPVVWDGSMAEFRE